ncbi:MAG TPA: phosphomethylpyrimidine synthase ThiC [Bacillota bacterium]|nr:phosphomethylpyrimidine synthase ThiC [Bacillota bacterium]
MNYTTQMDAARKGIVTKEMLRVAEREQTSVEKIMEGVAAGHIVIAANKNHRSLDPCGIGAGLATKINVNLGISRDCSDIETELIKVTRAIELKADAIMDLSSFGKTAEFRRRLLEIAPVAVGTVPVYDAIGFYEKELNEIEAGEFIGIVEQHAKDGVDFMTIHAGLNRAAADRFKNNPRLTNIVSRGGSLLYAWMELTGRENPFYEQFDRILDICERYDVTLSLGDALRPGSIQDATDASQIQELIILGELAERAWRRNVQVMVEGPGHMRLDEVQANVVLQKKLCHGAPFYVLGPLVTDVAPGYDHITGAIGGAIAAAAGADFLCYVTPAEHLRLPTVADMEEGITASRIAAHAADLVKGIAGAAQWDLKMSEARAALNWEQMFNLALDPAKARHYREESKPQQEDTCTMCGKICAVRTMNEIIRNGKVSSTK